MLDWDHLQSFLAVARGGSLSAAARSLKVTQTTMGRRIEALHAQAGVRLLQKTPSGFVLTQAGERVLAGVERIEVEALAVERAITGEDERIAGEVRITTVDSFGARVVIPILQQLREKEPGLQIELIADIRSLSLSRREADIAIRLAEFEQHEVMVSHVADLAFGLYLRTSALLTKDALDSFAPMTLLTRVGERSNGYACIFMVDDNGVAMRARSEFLRYARRQLSVGGGAATEPVDIGSRLLREVTVFESLDDDQVSSLAEGLELRRLTAGDTMFEQGSIEPSLYLIAEGVIEIRRGADGGEQVLGRIGAGEYIGEIGLLTGAPREVRAVALTEARIHVLDKHALEPLFAGNAGLVDAFEQSVRRGRQLLSRSLAAATSDAIDGSGDLIARIRRFFAKPEGLAP